MNKNSKRIVYNMKVVITSLHIRQSVNLKHENSVLDGSTM